MNGFLPLAGFRTASIGLCSGTRWPFGRTPGETDANNLPHISERTDDEGRKELKIPPLVFKAGLRYEGSVIKVSEVRRYESG